MRLVDNFFTPTHTNTNSLGRNRNTIVDVKLFTTRFNFPAIKDLGANEILGFGADLEPDTLLYAYTHGFFPWYNEPPITWQAPLVRMVLRKNEIHVSRSLKKFLRRSTHTVRKDTAFREVIHLCASLRSAGTWITPEMTAAYIRLHELGWAHSWETFDGEKLVGGLYGVVINRAAFLESTFHLKENAGKEAFVDMYDDLLRVGVDLFDFQVYSPIAASFGGYEIPREIYGIYLEEALR